MVRPSTTNALDSLRIERPLAQAGMAGGLAGGELAGAVSAAGGLGTVGMMAPGAFAGELATAKRVAGGRPVAANLLVPFITSAHVRICTEAEVALVVFHGGLPSRWIRRLRRNGTPAYVTVGTPEQARRALAAGADGLVVQGAEAGGHLLGVQPLERALPEVLAVAAAVPVLAAGGIAGAEDVRRVLDAGATAAVAGTRFVLTEESAAHPLYKQRLLEAQRTLATMLFGLGWPLLHRVVANAATERWCRRGELGPALLRAACRASGPLARRTPLGALGSLASRQRVGIPLFSPALPLEGMPASMVDSMALYAGESVAQMREVLSAAEAVERLTSDA